MSHNSNEDEILQGPLPISWTAPPSRPTPSRVGDCLIIPGDYGVVVPISLTQLLEHCIRSDGHDGLGTSSIRLKPLQEPMIYEKISYPVLHERTGLDVHVHYP